MSPAADPGNGGGGAPQIVTRAPVRRSLLPRALRAARTLRRGVRGSEAAIVLLAVAIGACVGGIAWAMGAAARGLHVLFFGIGPTASLSVTTNVVPWRLLLVPALGGLALYLLNRALGRWRPRQAADPIEANALHGGRMSLGDTVAVALQTVLSNGVGASVGLEAGYAQAGGGLASRLGMALGLRRGDLRVLVGAGTAGAIGAAFDAPLTGAFYAFELVIGSYAIPALFPVVACAVTAVMVARHLSAVTYEVVAAAPSVIDTDLYPLALLIGAVAGLAAILLMRGVTLTESLLARSVPHPALRLLLGGIAVGMLAQLSPIALSSGHGALHLTLLTETTAHVVAVLLAVKALASLVSIATGFRGGLFFASLLIGALGGKLCAAGLALLHAPGPDPMVMALVGMSAFGAAVIGAPLAMTFLALETTGSLQVAGLVLASVAVAGLLVRRLFGYSFATWRFHLRGEAIRSAHDIGWINALAAGRLMRPNPPTMPAGMSIGEFRAALPLGSATRMVLVDADGHYAGMVTVAEAHAAADAEAPISSLAHSTDRVLFPDTGAREAMAAFQSTEADALAVVDTTSHRVLGMLTEAHLLRRFGEEMERRRREESGLA